MASPDSKVIHSTDAEFENDVIKSDKPVLVDFWAAWCGPCKTIGPIVDDISKEFDGKLVVVKVDVDSNPNTPSEYGVRGIPTLLIFKNGEVIATKVGALTKGQLTSWLSDNGISA